jgi:very-short-patch-repair endonuclease
VSQYQRLSGYQLLLKRAQEHKDNPTSSEQRLLTALTQELPDLEFQFQVVMVPFIVDFVSLLKKVIIEVDGKSHIGNFDSDDTRQRDLERDGYSFIRFTHEEVMMSIDQVVGEVRKFCALSHGQRRKFASPQAEYVQKGTVPRVIGEQDPFAGLHTRAELEDILSEIDLYDFLEEGQAVTGTSAVHAASIICTSCNLKIQSSEPRFRDHSSSELVLWVHKNCRP